MRLVKGQRWRYGSGLHGKEYVIGAVKPQTVTLLNDRGEIVNLMYQISRMESNPKLWTLVEDVAEPLILHCPRCTRKRLIPEGDYICKACRATIM